MLLFCLLLFPLIHDASPPLFFMEMLKSSKRSLVTSVEFSKAPYSPTLKCLFICCSYFNVFWMKKMMQTGACLDAVGNTQRILVFSHTTVSMQVNP